MIDDKNDALSGASRLTAGLGVNNTKITHGGLVAGVRFLQAHCEGFDDGTGDDFRTPFIRDLLLEVCRASNITLDMPAERRYAREPNASKGRQEKGRLLAFRLGPDGAHLTVELDLQ